MRRLAVLLALIPALAHAEERAFTACPDVGAGQSIRYENGAALLYAETPQAAMFMALQPRDKRTGYAWLGIRNKGFSPFNITENDLSAASGGTPLKMIKFAERANEVRKAGKWRAVGAALAAGAGGYAAGASGGRGQFNGTVYSGGQSATYSGTYYDPAAANAAQARVSQQTAANAAAVRGLNASDAAALQSRAIVAQTIDPGVTATGDVVFEIPRTQPTLPITLTVNVAGTEVVASFIEDGSACPPSQSFDSRLDELRERLRKADPQYDARLPEVMKRVGTYEGMMSKLNDVDRIKFLERLYWSTPTSP